MLELYMPEYHFEIYQSGKKALTNFKEGKYVLAIIDLLLKGSRIQGPDIIKKIRKLDSSIEIIVVTGMEYGASPLDKTYDELQPITWKKKPIKASVLEYTIRQLTSKS